jgi:hypothetical protein
VSAKITEVAATTIHPVQTVIIKVNQSSNFVSVDTLNTFCRFILILNPMDMQSDIQSVDHNLNLIEVFGRKP